MEIKRCLQGYSWQFVNVDAIVFLETFKFSLNGFKRQVRFLAFFFFY